MTGTSFRLTLLLITETHQYFLIGAASTRGDFLNLAYFCSLCEVRESFLFVYELFMDDNFILLTGKYLLAWTGKISLPRV